MIEHDLNTAREYSLSGLPLTLASLFRESRASAPTLSALLSIDRCFVRCDGANKSTYQRSQFIKGWNVHYERNIPADFLLTDIEFDMQK